MRLLWRMIGLLRLLTYKLARAVVGRSLFFFFKQKTAYEMRISDWSSTCALPILASHILIQVEPGADAAAQKAAEEKAAAIAAEARKPGADFAVLAREDSDDTGSKDSGGDLGWIAHDGGRSEEHTSELQSLMRISYAVFCLKKKNKETNTVISQN